jgi:hypothetical protein
MCREQAHIGNVASLPRLIALGSMVGLAACGSSSPAPVPSTVTVSSLASVQLSGAATDDEGAPA